MRHEAIMIGVSSGGLNALKIVLLTLPVGFAIPVIIVQHVSSRSDGHWIELLNEKSNIRIKEADEKEKIENGTIYTAPPNYHLMIEKDKTFSLTIDERVNFARPSIDVLFESAAACYKNKLIGIILTGANSDGSKGIKQISENGGLTIVQDPGTAESPVMPESALSAITPDHILSLDKISTLLISLDIQNKI